MEEIRNSIEQAIQYLMTASVADIIDMLVIAVILYTLLGFIRRTNTRGITIGIILLFAALWISGWARLTVFNNLLRTAIEMGLLALVIIFQPEIRRFLERMGSGDILSFLKGMTNEEAINTAISQTVLACASMSKDKVGALIVFERLNKLDNQIDTGTIIKSEVTAELIKNIFFDKAPLHDGAIIISDGRIAAAGCVLPLSNNSNLSRDLGMRHRAAIGLSEHSDAVIAIVSEETGSVSIAVDGMLKRHLSMETFEKILRNELYGDEHERKKGLGRNLLDMLRGKGKKHEHEREQND